MRRTPSTRSSALRRAGPDRSAARQVLGATLQQLLLNPRLAPVAEALQQRFGFERAPVIQMRRGRLTVTVRVAGLLEWSVERQLQLALDVAQVTRTTLGLERRRKIRNYARAAVVLKLEDRRLVQSCVMTTSTSWVVTAPPAAVATPA